MFLSYKIFLLMCGVYVRVRVCLNVGKLFCNFTLSP